MQIHSKKQLSGANCRQAKAAGSFFCLESADFSSSYLTVLSTHTFLNATQSVPLKWTPCIWCRSIFLRWKSSKNTLCDNIEYSFLKMWRSWIRSLRERKRNVKSNVCEETRMPIRLCLCNWCSFLRDNFPEFKATSLQYVNPEHTLLCSRYSSARISCNWTLG